MMMMMMKTEAPGWGGGRKAAVVAAASAFAAGFAARGALEWLGTWLWDTAVAQSPSLAAVLRIMARVLGVSDPPKQPTPQTLVDATKEDLLAMIFHVAEEQTLRDGVVHRGVTCNNCKATPIKGTRYKCANCPDFDLCADCELQDVHNSKHVFIKIKTVVPPQLNPRKPLCPQLFPGDTRPKERILWESLKKLESFFNVSRSSITAYFNEFQLLVDSEDPPGISPARFRELMGEYGAHPNLIVDRLFYLFDADRDGIIGFADMLGTMCTLEHGSYDDKVKLAFRGMDLEERGHLVPADVSAILRAFLELTVMQVTDLVSSLQSEMVQTLDDRGSKPVSALFTAPIGLPSDTAPQKGEEAAAHIHDMEWTPQAQDRHGPLHATPELSTKGLDAVGVFVSRLFDSSTTMSWEQFAHVARVHPLLVTWMTSLGTIF